METTIKKLPHSEVELKIELSVEEFKQFIERAALNLGKNLELKGFRKGKVPKEIIEKEIGSEKILIEAADLAVRENYIKAIIENKIEAVSQPKIEIQKLPRPTSPLAQLKAGGVQDDSFVFLAKTAVLPEIKLPDYKKIASNVERKKIIVEENEVKEALKWFQRSRAKLTLKNQPAQKGDFVEIEYWLPETLELTTQKGQKDAFILGEGHFIPGFEEKLIGMKAGPASAPDGATAGKEEKEFSLTIPEKHPLRKTVGEKLTLKVKMESVQNIEFPEINDQFASNFGKFKNLAELKKSIREGLTLKKEQAESQIVRSEILEKISQATECEIPDILIEQEQKQMLENLKKNVSENLKISFGEYLEKINPVRSYKGKEKLQSEQTSNGIKKTEKEILNSFLLEAQKKVRNYLVLREIGKREKIEVSKEEIKSEVDKRNLDLENLKEYTKEVIRNEKIFQLLEQLTRY